MYTPEEIKDYIEQIRHLKMHWVYLFIKNPLIKCLEETIKKDPEKFGIIGSYEITVPTVIDELKFYFTKLHEILNVIPLEEVPLHINDKNPYVSQTAKWRLKIRR